jgi:hypothetical protein
MIILGGYSHSAPFLSLQYGRKIAAGSIGFNVQVHPRCVVFTLATFR